MKNSSNSLSFAAPLLFLFATGFTQPAHATETSPVTAKYVSNLNSVPVFQLSFTNEQTETYEITVAEGRKTIYTETITGKELVRKFQFVNEGSEEEVLQVSVKNVNTQKVIIYKINPATNTEVEKDLVATL